MNEHSSTPNLPSDSSDLAAEAGVDPEGSEGPGQHSESTVSGVKGAGDAGVGPGIAAVKSCPQSDLSGSCDPTRPYKDSGIEAHNSKKETEEVPPVGVEPRTPNSTANVLQTPEAKEREVRSPPLGSEQQNADGGHGEEGGLDAGAPMDQGRAHDDGGAFEQVSEVFERPEARRNGFGLSRARLIPFHFPSPHSRPRFRHADVDQHLDSLRECGLLLAVCDCPSILGDLSVLLASELRDLAVVRAIDESLAAVPDAPQFSFDQVLRALDDRVKPKESSEHLLCLVEVQSPSLCQSLLAALRYKETESMVRHLHKDFGYHVACLVHGSLRKGFRLSGDGWYASWNVDFVGPLLRDAIDDEERAHELEHLVREQISSGLWPADSATISGKLERLLVYGAGALQAEMERLAEEGVSKKLPDLTVLEPHKCAAAFVAAQGSPVSPGSFDMLVEGQLSEVTVERRRTKSNAKEKNQEQGQGEREALDAIELWRREKNEIVREFGLQLMSDEHIGMVLSFPRSGYARDFARAFRDAWPFYEQEALSRLTGSGLCAREELPSDAADTFAGLAVRVASDYPTSFSGSWLQTLDLWARTAASIVAIKVDDEDESEREYTIRRAVRPWIYRERMGSLLCSLYQHVDTRALVEGHLIKMIKESEWAALPILCQELANLPEFDFLEWTRRILEEAPTCVQVQVYLGLLRDAAARGPRSKWIVEYLKERMQEHRSNERQGACARSHTSFLAAAAPYEIFLLLLPQVRRGAGCGIAPGVHALLDLQRVWCGTTTVGTHELAQALLHPQAGPAVSWVEERGKGSRRVRVNARTEALLVAVLHQSLLTEDERGMSFTLRLIGDLRDIASREQRREIVRWADAGIAMLRAESRFKGGRQDDRPERRRRIQAHQTLRKHMRSLA